MNGLFSDVFKSPGSLLLQLTNFFLSSLQKFLSHFFYSQESVILIIIIILITFKLMLGEPVLIQLQTNVIEFLAVIYAYQFLGNYKSHKVSRD